MSEEFNVGDIIDYIDCTRDLHLEAAYHWAAENNADVVELIENRKTVDGIMYRQFQIVNKQGMQVEKVEVIEEGHVDTPEEKLDKEKVAIRERLIDRYTIRRIRKMANHTWTPEDEAAYLLLDAQVTGIIENLYKTDADKEESGDESL